jgi:hypothetical protein
MPLAREVPDFTAIARSSLYEAIAIPPAPFQPAVLQGLSPLQAFVACLASGASFRRAAKCGGFNRPHAKDVFRLIAKAALQIHATPSVRSPSALRHAAAWAFSEKRRQPPRSRLDRNDQHAVWTHVWIDDDTGLLSNWVVGPSPAILQSTEPAFARGPILRRWIASKPKGIAKKVDLHAQAVTFFATHQNFCVAKLPGVTPAMLTGYADHPWTARDLAALAAGSTAEGDA